MCGRRQGFRVPAGVPAGPCLGFPVCRTRAGLPEGILLASTFMRTPSHACEGTEPAFPMPSPSREFSTRGQGAQGRRQETEGRFRQAGWRLSVCLSHPIHSLSPHTSPLPPEPRSGCTDGRKRPAGEAKEQKRTIHAAEGRPHSPRLGERESRPGGQRAAAQCAVSPPGCQARTRRDPVKGAGRCPPRRTGQTDTGWACA